MPEFKNREEYEKWKSERSNRSTAKGPSGDRRDKAPDRAPQKIAERRDTARPSVGPAAQKTGSGATARTVVTASLLGVLVIVFTAVLFFNWNRLTSVFSQQPENASSAPQDIVRPANFNELLGTWSGSEINRSPGWTFIFSHGYNVHASGPEGSFRGKAAIHWKLGGDSRGIRVPPGAGVLDVDIEESSAGDYAGKTAVGAFAIHGGSNLKLCSGEPGKTKRPETFEPASGIRCFELAKTAEAPPPPQPSQEISRSAPSSEAPSVEDDETRSAREAFRRCAEAARSGNMDEAKTHIARSTLAEMEQSGQFDMAMGMMTGMNLDEFRASRQGDRITFRKSEKQGDATMSMSITMVKEDGQWKLGK